MESMRSLQECLEEGCRTIEEAMARDGRRAAVSVLRTAMDHKMVAGVWSSDPKEGGRHSPPSIYQAELVIRDLGPTTKPVNLPEQLTNNAGLNAGMKALLEKFQKGIKNATDICTGVIPHWELNKIVDRAALLRSDDPVPKLLIEVSKLRKAGEDASERAREAEKKLLMEEDPEVQLRQRLKMKLRTKYLEKAQVLREFQQYIFENYSAMFPETVPKGQDGRDVVSEFLERVGED